MVKPRHKVTQVSEVNQDLWLCIFSQALSHTHTSGLNCTNSLIVCNKWGKHFRKDLW